MKEDLKTKLSYNSTICATRKYFSGRFFILMVWVLAWSCNQSKDILNAPIYEGPLSTMDSATTLLSDSGKIVMRMIADKQGNFENGDREWESGFEIKWYEKNGEKKTFFRANYVYYTKAENLYRAEGNVVVKSYENNDELNTEQLFWNQKEEQFYTEKFVTIKSDDELHTGEGLEANQDFTEYHITHPDGTFTLEDHPNVQTNPREPMKRPISQ